MTGNASRLVALTKALSVQWEQTRAQWRDAKCREFEHHYLEELWGGVDRALPVMEQLDNLVKKIRSDCE